MIWLLLLACSDKDGSDDTGGATDDTGGATDDTGDVVDDFSCTLSALSPFTVPIDESTDLTATLTCTVDAELTKVTLDGDEVEFGQSGTALTMKTLPKQSGRYTYTFWIKPLGKDAPPVSVDGEFRAHTAPVFDGPTNLTHLTDEGELLAMTASATLTRSEDSIIELTDDGQEVGRFKHTWLLDGDASCATQMPIAVCGTLGTDAVGWVNVESQKTQWVEVDGTVDAFAPGELGPVIAYTKPAQADNQSSGTQVRTHDGKTYDVGLLEGLLELKEAELLHGECDKDGFFQLTEISYVGAKVKSINSVGVQCPTTGAWQMMSLDLDDDGDLDELHTFDQGDTVDLVARIQENEESWSVHTAVLQGSNPQFNADSSITITSGSLLFKDQATFGADSTITVNRTWIGTSPGASYIRSGRGSAVTDDNGNTWFVEHAQPWVLDLGNGGEELTRTNDAAGIAFAVDGAEVKAYVDTPLTGFYDNHVVSITAEDMVIDEGLRRAGGRHGGRAALAGPRQRREGRRADAAGPRRPRRDGRGAAGHAHLRRQAPLRHHQRGP
jgi:hypothetical protein